MARVFIDGFETGDTQLWDYTDTDCTSIIGSGAVIGMPNKYLKGTGGTPRVQLRKDLAEKNTYYFYFKYASHDIYSNPTYTRDIFLLYHDTTQLFAMRKNNTVPPKFEYLLGGVLQGNSAEEITVINNAIHVSIEFRCADSGGFLRIFLNGQLSLEVLGDTKLTAETLINKMYVGGVYTIIDDVVVDDAVLPMYSSIIGLLPNGPGTYTQYTPVYGRATYWRVNILTNGGNSNNTAMVAMEMRTSLGGANVCIDTGRITAVGTWGGWPPSALIDGIESNYWVTTTQACSFTYQFAEAVAIVQYVMRPFTTPVVDQINTPKSWELQMSNDNVTYITVDSRSNQINWEASEGRIYDVSGAGNWSCVDDAVPSGIDFVKTSTVDLKDTYTLPDLAHIGSIVKSVSVTARVGYEGDPEVKAFKLLLRSGIAEAASDTITLSPIGVKSYSKIWETDPNTAGLPWTETAIDNVEIGVMAKGV